MTGYFVALAVALVLIGLDLLEVRRGRSGHSHRRQRELARTPPAPSPSRLPRPVSSGWQRLEDDLLGCLSESPRHQMGLPVDAGLTTQPIHAASPDAALEQLLHECGWDQP